MPYSKGVHWVSALPPSIWSGFSIHERRIEKELKELARQKYQEKLHAEKVTEQERISRLNLEGNQWLAAKLSEWGIAVEPSSNYGITIDEITLVASRRNSVYGWEIMQVAQCPRCGRDVMAAVRDIGDIGKNLVDPYVDYDHTAYHCVKNEVTEPTTGEKLIELINSLIDERIG